MFYFYLPLENYVRDSNLLLYPIIVNNWKKKAWGEIEGKKKKERVSIPPGVLLSGEDSWWW